MENFFNMLNDLIWSMPLIILCLGAGLFFSISTGFVQFRKIKEMVSLLFAKEDSEAGVSSFQAFAIAVSGRVGTGNIAGVATAIAYGGPGALFWMWVIALLGAGSAFVESVLAQIYKIESDGEYRGGPAYYIEIGIGNKAYAAAFAIVTILAMGILMPGTQSNSISAGLNSAFNISPLVTGVVLSILFAAIIFGGVKRIARVTEVVVPVMGIGYIIIALIIIFANISYLPETIALIFKSAFGAEAAFGGILGATISWGVKRGIYSNEAGQGTGPHAAAAAEVTHPAKQGLVQVFGVYFDTLFVCTATGLMIIMTGMYNVFDTAGTQLYSGAGNVAAGPIYVQQSVDTFFPGFGSAFIAIALFFFAFTTLLAYYYMAETNVTYLFRGANARRVAINAVRLFIIGSSLIGCLRTADLAWVLGDIGVGAMAWLNVIAILILRKPAITALKDYETQQEKGLEPTFNPQPLGIKNSKFWEHKSKINK